MPEPGRAPSVPAARAMPAPPAGRWPSDGDRENVNDLDHALHAAIIEACGGFSPVSLGRAWLNWGLHMTFSPGRRMELAGRAGAEAARLAGLAVASGGGQRADSPSLRSRPQDRRFRDDAWTRWPFSLFAEGLLSAERLWDEATAHLHGADPHSLALLNFVGRQAIDAIAPTNFLFTNPVALAKTREEGGANLVRGWSNLLRDVAHARRGERPEAAMVWTPGKSVAVTPGAVVKRTALAEVIQYRPTTEKVRPEPVVITPAWIMKYYILDLRPENSMVKALTDAGFTVFVVSWRNPTVADRDVGFDDYRKEGVLPAISAALSITGASKAHLVGYCIGGALSAVTAAAMARDLDDRLRSLSLFAAQVDYSEAGELRLFIDDSQVDAIEDVTWERGYFEGSRMAGTFNLLRSNDLIWSNLVHHYLMGEPEALDDLSAWATDTTRLPYAMHRDYLRSFYLNNDFAEGRLKVDRRVASARDIRVPLFALGTETDHVAPWRSVFKVHHFVDGDVTFALTNGGHNHGVVSPPGRPDRHFRLTTTAETDPRPDPDAWFVSTPVRSGSWWNAWFEWLQARSGTPVAPPPLGRPEVGLPALEAAPGTYVFG
jgi:polyhydroxyalkanoate synthase subunit PhaC